MGSISLIVDKVAKFKSNRKYALSITIIPRLNQQLPRIRSCRIIISLGIKRTKIVKK